MNKTRSDTLIKELQNLKEIGPFLVKWEVWPYDNYQTDVYLAVIPLRPSEGYHRTTTTASIGAFNPQQFVVCVLTDGEKEILCTLACTLAKKIGLRQPRRAYKKDENLSDLVMIYRFK